MTFKKLLIPLVVLLLCGVALTGAAYAYNSTVNGTGTADVDYVTLQIGDNDDCSVTASADLQYTVVNNKGTKTYTLDTTAIIFNIKVKVIENESEATLTAPTVTVTDASSLGITYNVTATGGDKDTGFTYTVKATASEALTTAPAGTANVTIVATLSGLTN